MIVKELIEILQKCDPELPVYVFVNDDIHMIDVDTTISDRIDINIDEEDSDATFEDQVDLSKSMFRSSYMISDEELAKYDDNGKPVKEWDQKDWLERHAILYGNTTEQVIEDLQDN